MKKILYTLLLSASIHYLQAQNIVDAGRFGTTDLSGTARYTSMAGAFGALGGDPTCMNDNPAGIGVYRGTSLFTFSPTMQVSRAKTDGSFKDKEKKSDYSVSNLAYIISIRPEGTEYLVNFNIGLGFNHSEGMNRKYHMTLDNPKSSFGQYLSTRANNALDANNRYYDPDYLMSDNAWADRNMPLMALMGYDVHAIEAVVNEQDQPVGGVISLDEALGLQPYQRLFVKEKNRIDEYNINLSGNWDDVIYGGMTLSIVDFNSTIISRFDEDYEVNYEGEYTAYANDAETQGSGVNVKLGVIWRPIDALRLGFSVHTPTWYDMKDYYNGEMDTEYSEYTSIASMDGPYEYHYKYISPWSLQYSAAYIFGQKAILSLEYDLKDFASARYRSKSDRYKDEYDGINALIKEHMQLQHTIKGGFEYRVTPCFSLRAGYAYQTSPYSQAVLDDKAGKTWGHAHKEYCDWGDDRTFMYDASTKPNYSLLDGTQYICGGLGWNINNWYIDFSVMDRIVNEKIAAYPTTHNVTFDNYWNAEFFPGVVADHIDMKSHIMKYDLTIGYKF